MTFELWQRVPLNTSMFAVDKLSLLVLVKDKEEILASVRGNSGQNNFVFYAPISKADHPIPYYSPQDNLGALMSEVVRSSDIEMIAIPPIQWGSEAFSLRNPANLKRLAAIVGGLALIVVVGVLNPLYLTFITPLYGVLISLMYSRGRRSGTKTTQIAAAGEMRLDGSNIVGYALARSRGEHPQLPTDTQRRADIVKRVEDLKEEYGRLYSDLVYRIENAALFDSSAPLTSEFLVLLSRYDLEGDTLPVGDLDDLAAELEISYVTARDHAETAGMRHLPAEARQMQTARRRRPGWPPRPRTTGSGLWRWSRSGGSWSRSRCTTCRPAWCAAASRTAASDAADAEEGRGPAVGPGLAAGDPARRPGRDPRDPRDPGRLQPADLAAPSEPPGRA